MRDTHVEEGNRIVLEDIEKLYHLVHGFMDEHVLTCVTMNSMNAKTVRAQCRHGHEHLLWREVHTPIYESLAEMPYVGQTGIRSPEEWHRLKDVILSVEDINPILYQKPQYIDAQGLCQFCREGDDWPDPFDPSGESDWVGGGPRTMSRRRY